MGGVLGGNQGEPGVQGGQSIGACVQPQRRREMGTRVTWGAGAQTSGQRWGRGGLPGRGAAAAEFPGLPWRRAEARGPSPRLSAATRGWAPGSALQVHVLHSQTPVSRTPGRPVPQRGSSAGRQGAPPADGSRRACGASCHTTKPSPRDTVSSQGPLSGAGSV